MLTDKLLSSLREYIADNFRPAPEKHRFQSICSSRPAAPQPDAAISAPEDKAALPSEAFSSPREDAYSVQEAAPAFDDDSFCDIVSIFSGDRIKQYVNSNRTPSFSSELMRLIDESGCKDSEIYSRAGIDRRHFSKIRSNPDYHPSKQTAAAFCLALRLSREQSTQLLSSAGYSLSSSEIFDLIISFCLENEIYDLTDVNTALVYFSLKPIGAAE